jgi:hypothetical protein
MELHGDLRLAVIADGQDDNVILAHEGEPTVADHAIGSPAVTLRIRSPSLISIGIILAAGGEVSAAATYPSSSFAGPTAKSNL